MNILKRALTVLKLVLIVALLCAALALFLGGVDWLFDTVFPG